MSHGSKSTNYPLPKNEGSVASRESYGRSRSTPIIAVIGIAKTGKSTFISKLPAEDYDYANDHDDDPEAQFEAVKCRMDGRKFILVDTPGLDYKSPDPHIMLKQLNGWLLSKYGPNSILAGIIYLHDISHPRVAEHTHRAYKLLQRLTGREDTRKLVLVTTKWDVLGHSTTRGQRYQARLEMEQDWDIMIQDGAKVIKHDGSSRSAQNIVLSILGEKQVETGSEASLRRQSRSDNYISMSQQLLEYQKRELERERKDFRRTVRENKRREKQLDKKLREMEEGQERSQLQRAADRSETRSEHPSTSRREPRHSPQSINSDYCSNPSFKFHSWLGGVSCHQCGWKDSSGEQPIQLAAGWHMPPSHVIRSHAPGQKNAYKCRVCGEMYKFKDFEIHMRQHGVAQIRRAYGENAVKPGRYSRYKELYGKDPPSTSDTIWEILTLKDM